MSESYESCLKRLDAMIGRGIRPSIASFQEALRAAGLDDPLYRRVLVAGTNGKGSVCAMSAEALKRAGLRVGLLTSPHLVDVRERVRLDGEVIGEVAFTALFTALLPVFEAHRLTYYEALVLLGLAFFARERADVAVLEVGMGGRWDATNALSPHLTAITTVSYDHQAYLGATLAEIAAEKAAIARPGVTLVCGAQDDQVRLVIQEYCASIGARYLDVSEVDCGVYPRYLPGRHQYRNAAVAHTLLKEFQKSDARLLDPHIAAGIRDARHAGRLEQILSAPPVFLDGAHNSEGMRALRAFAEEQYPSRKAVLIFSVMKDKDYAAIARTFPDWVERVFFVPLVEERALPFEAFAEICPVPCERLQLGVISPAFFASFPKDPLIVICGSLYLVGAVLRQWPESSVSLG